MTRADAFTLALAVGALAIGFALYARDYSRALETCERIHSRATCIHSLR